MRLMWNLIKYFKSYSFRRQFRRQFLAVFFVILQAPSDQPDCPVNFVEFEQILQKLLKRLVWNLTEYFKSYSLDFAGDCPVNFVKFERVPQKLLMRLMWNLIKYFKSYSFRRQFRRQFSTVFHVILQAPSMVLWPLPWKFCKVCKSTSNVINEINVKFAWVFQYIYSCRRQFRRQFSTVFHVILQAPSAGTTATAQWIWRSLIEYFKSYLCKALSQRCDNVGGAFFFDISVNSQPFYM